MISYHIVMAIVSLSLFSSSAPGGSQASRAPWQWSRVEIAVESAENSDSFVVGQGLLGDMGSNKL